MGNIVVVKLRVMVSCVKWGIINIWCIWYVLNVVWKVVIINFDWVYY